MSSRWVFAAVAILAMFAGAALWSLNRPEPALAEPSLTADALYSATFPDAAGRPRSLSEFRGRTVVLNFWATWCAPCRAEMPGFSRLQSRWSARQVQFIGLTGDDPHETERFLKEVNVTYPILLGGPTADEWARRFGNRHGVLPFTVILDARGTVVARKVGLYSEADLHRELEQVAPKSSGN